MEIPKIWRRNEIKYKEKKQMLKKQKNIGAKVRKAQVDNRKHKSLEER